MSGCYSIFVFEDNESFRDLINVVGHLLCNIQFDNYCNYRYMSALRAAWEYVVGYSECHASSLVNFIIYSNILELNWANCPS